MILTEEEAKTKWCPFALSCTGINRPINNLSGFEIADRRCIASQCMAWRWGQVARTLKDGTLIMVGFCGLAGKVEG